MSRLLAGKGWEAKPALRRGLPFRVLIALVMLLGVGSTRLLAQENVISGVVVEQQTLRPLPNVQIQVVGTDRGTLSDANGRFRIVNAGGGTVELQFTMIGYRTEKRTVRVGGPEVRVVMAQAAVELDAIVVTGTAGGQQKRALGNSISSVNAAQAVANAPVRTVQDLLNGRAAGVMVMPATGMVGSGSKIRIRGVSSFSLSNDPLIYVDGVRVNNEAATGIAAQGFGSSVISRLNDFDPSQIESVEILKGPAAATLYGTEASRGVINIITKRGALGGTRYSVAVRQGANWFSNPEGRLPLNYWRDPQGNVQELNLYKRREEQGKPVFRTGRIQHYSANVSGGGAGVRYYVGGDLSMQEGAEPTSNREQWSGRVNVDVTPSQKFEISASTGYVHNETSLSCEGGCAGAMFGLVFSSPQFLKENECAPGQEGPCGYRDGFRIWSPEAYWMMDIGQDVDRFTGSLKLTYRPFDWMTNRFTFGTDVTQEQNEEYLPYLTNDTLLYFWGPTTGKGYKYQTRRAQTFNTYDFSSTAEFALTSSLTSATSLGVQYYTRHIEFIGAEGDQFAGPGLATIGAAAIKPYAEDDYLDNNTLGLFVQEMVGWKDRLFLTGALRVDNNSAFGSDVDFVAYPKASLSYVMTEEPRVRELLPDAVETFKLRMAYGQSGTQPAIFSALRTFAAVTGPNGTPAITPSTVGNPDLKPERGEEIEVGFDAGLFDDRLGFDFTYYHKRTRDGILLRATPPSEGFSGSRYINAGALLNTGIEALIHATPIRSDRLVWDMSLNVATNRGKVEQLAGGDTTIISGWIQHRIGYAPQSWFREKVVSAKYDPATDQVTDVMCDDGEGGMTPCYDASGNVVAPRVFIGRTVPSMEGSFNTTVTVFGNIVLAGMVDFKTGYKKYNNNYQARCVEFRTCLENMYPERYDPKLIAQIRSGGRLTHSFHEDASFARLRELSLTYNLTPAQAARLLGSRNASVQVAARNLYTWALAGYTGLDPEAHYLSAGFDEQSMMPALMQLVASVNVSF